METINQKFIDDVHNVRQYTEAEYQQFINASGDPDDDTGEPETTEPTSEDESGVPAADLPKFRTLVRAKKLALKAQYGRGHIEIIKNKWGLPIGIKRVRGWRYYWKRFKFNGGKAQLKLQAQTPVPIPPPLIPQIEPPPTIPTAPDTGDTDNTKSKELGATWIKGVPNYVPVIGLILLLGGVYWSLSPSPKIVKK